MEHEDMPPLEDESKEIPANGNDSEGFTSDDSDDEALSCVECREEVSCLFCDVVLLSVNKGLRHLSEKHNIEFAQLKDKFQMDQYSFIKLINCIRSDNISAEKLMETEEVFWNDEKYLKPMKYEAWLSYDYDEMLAGSATQVSMHDKKTADTDLSSLQQKIIDQTLLLEHAAEDMLKMRISFQRMVENDSSDKTTDSKPLNSVAASSLEADEGYFSGYAHFGIHHEMLSDTVRTISYRDALLKNRDFVQGKDVLDVGCGTSVLSIFASQAGAKTVVGIDNSDIIYNAMDIVRKNNIRNIILVKGRLEDTELPQQKFDIIISEWMGYFLLFEGMLDTIIYARDNHLKEGGVLLPNRCTMSLVGYGSDELYKGHVTFWNDVYGLDMSNMRKEVMHEPLIGIVDAKHILTESNVVADLNLATANLEYSNFSYNFNMKCIKDGNLSAFVGYFDTHFDLPVPVMFGTGPRDKPTHWKQVVFFLEQTQLVRAGDMITGKLWCKRSRKSPRSLDITIKAFGKTYIYYLD